MSVISKFVLNGSNLDKKSFELIVSSTQPVTLCVIVSSTNPTPSPPCPRWLPPCHPSVATHRHQLADAANLHCSVHNISAVSWPYGLIYHRSRSRHALAHTHPRSPRDNPALDWGRCSHRHYLVYFRHHLVYFSHHLDNLSHYLVYLRHHLVYFRHHLVYFSHHLENLSHHLVYFKHALGYLRHHLVYFRHHLVYFRHHLVYFSHHLDNLSHYLGYLRHHLGYFWPSH